MSANASAAEVFTPNSRIDRTPSLATTNRPFGVADAAMCFLIAALLATATGLRISQAALQGGLENPDTYMRLDRLNDMISRNSPLHEVLRDASGDGAVMSWSHLFDSLLMLLASPLRLFMDQASALHGAALVCGPLEIGLLGAAAAWALAPLANRNFRWAAPVLAGMASPIVSYGVPGEAHHHVLVAMTAVVMAGMAGRAIAGDVRSGWRMGAWAGTGIWLTPETMPFALMAFGGVGFAWLLDPRGRARGDALAAGGCAFLLVIAAAFAVDPPMRGYGSVEIDRLSIVYVALALSACAVGWLLGVLGRSRLGSPMRRRIAVGGVIAALSMWLGLFPSVLKGPDGLMDAASSSAFFGAIAEMQPLASTSALFEFAIDVSFAMAILLWFAMSRRSWAWAYAALCLAAMALLGLQHARFCIYGVTAAIAMAPVALTEITRMLARRPPSAQALARIGFLAAMVMATRAPAAAGVLGLGAPAEAGQGAVAAPRYGSACPVSGLASMLEPYAGQVVLTDVNDAPELLYRTKILTVGSLYHRNIAGFLRLRAAWLSGPSAAVPQAVRATRAAFILACPDASLKPAAEGSPGPLAERLRHGDIPPWLSEAARDPVSGNVLYRIADPL